MFRGVTAACPAPQGPAARRCCRSALGEVGFALSNWTVCPPRGPGGAEICVSRGPLVFQRVLTSLSILNNILYMRRVFMYFGISYDA